MAISTSAKLATVKVWNATLVIDETTFQLTAMPSRTLGTNQQRGTCSGVTNVFPDFPSGTEAHVEIMLNGESERYFTGKLDVRPISDNPPTYEVSLIDTQSRFDVPLGEEVVWSNLNWDSVVSNLLHRAGLIDLQIAGIYNPGSAFKVAPNYAITLEATTSIGDLLDELMTFAGAQLLVLEDGRVNVVDAPGWPEDEPTIVYAYGANKAADEFGFTGSKRTLGSSEDVVAEFKAYGPKRPDKQIPDATFKLTGVTGKKDSQQYRLIQTDSCADAIAEREIVRRNRSSTLVEMTAPLNPSLRPGDSLMFRNPILGWSTNTPAIIISTSASDDTMTLQISVGARPAAGDVSNIPPPVADFTLRYEQQPISLSGIIAPYYVVEATYAAYDPSAFEITSFGWTATCDGEVDPESSDVDNPVFVFSTTDGATITLTVESSSGEGDVTTKSVSPPSSALFTRVLSVASPAGWRILTGATGWRTFGEDCTAVPGINDVGPLIAGFLSGELYKTEDYLATDPTLLFTFSAAVRCLFVNESNGQEILAGVGSTIHRSSDGGITWAAGFSFENPINYCESSGADPSEVRVCSGQSLFISYDGGDSFTPLLTGPEGTTCRKVASAPWGHLAVWSGTSDINDATQFEEGGSLDWSTVPVEFLPIDLASVTPVQYQEGYVLAAGAGNDIIRDGLYGQLTYLSAADGPTLLYAVGPDKVVTYLSQTNRGGPHKLVVHNKAFLIDDIEEVFHVGYGQATDPGLPSEFVLLPSGITGAMDKAWHYIPNLGFFGKQLPLAGAEWLGIDINPNNLRHWLIWTATRVYVSMTGGESWIRIELPEVVNLAPNGMDGVSAVFTGKGGEWLVTADYVGAFGANRWSQGYFIYGRDTTITTVRTTGTRVVDPPVSTDVYVSVSQLVRGRDGNIWGYGTDVQVSFSGGDPGPYQIYTIEPTSLTPTLVAASLYAPAALFSTSENKGLALWEENIGYTENYKTTAPTALIAAGYSVAVVDVSPTVQRVFVGNRTGIAEVLTPLVNPTLSVVAGGSTEIGPITAGSRRRGAAAVSADVGIDGRLLIFTYNGMQWVTVSGPEGLTVAGAIGVPEA